MAGDLIPEVVPLRPRPATVAIAAPGGSEIYIDGVYAGHGGERVVLELTSGTHRMAIAERGHRVAVRTLELERGKTQDLRVDLEPTRQRRAANVLFITGAGALAAGAVFGALALGAQESAQDFLQRQSQGSVSSRELADYDDNVAARERFRVATAASLASAAGLFITGFFLYEFDRPASEDIHRPSRDPLPRTARGELPSLRIAPMLAPNGMSATLHATF
jgi:hypothetical protein